MWYEKSYKDFDQASNEETLQAKTIVRIQHRDLLDCYAIQS